MFGRVAVLCCLGAFLTGCDGDGPNVQVGDEPNEAMAGVRFGIDSSGEDFCLTLVYPKDVDGSGNTISILAPVGSALLGLSTGDEIEWPRPGGGTIKVRIVEVIYQPERAGKFHR